MVRQNFDIPGMYSYPLAQRQPGRPEPTDPVIKARLDALRKESRCLVNSGKTAEAKSLQADIDALLNAGH